MALPPDAADDSAIVRRVLDGDADVFAELMRRHAGRVQKAVSWHVPRDRVEELTQETFVRAYTSLANFEAGTKFPEWLSTIAVRTCHDYWRTHYRRREVTASVLMPEHRDWADRVTAARSQEEFLAQTQREEAREVLQYALERLTPEDRLVVTLVHLEGQSVEDVARRLGWTTVNVKVRAHRARRRMRKELETLLDSSGRTP
jgi:RNA polymerase sigma-70 factor (ECF subfamily)